MSDLVERLRAYNPPDRTIDEQRQIAVDIHEAADRIAQLEAALRPLACTCKAKHQAECSRSEVDCPFWNARAALEDRT